MSYSFDFKPGNVTYETYSDGTVVPHHEIDVLLNGQKIGYLEVHMHKKQGLVDSAIDIVSYGLTAVTDDTLVAKARG